MMVLIILSLFFNKFRMCGSCAITDCIFVLVIVVMFFEFNRFPLFVAFNNNTFNIAFDPRINDKSLV